MKPEGDRESRKPWGGRARPRKATVFNCKHVTLPFASKGHEVSSWRLLRTRGIGGGETLYTVKGHLATGRGQGTKRPLLLEGQKRVWLEGYDGDGPVDFGQDTGSSYWPVAFGASGSSQEGGVDSVIVPLVEAPLRTHSWEPVRQQDYSTKVL